MTSDWLDDRFGIDHNGCLTELVDVGGQEVVVHYDDLPDRDVTTVRGVPCTTALRTVIDLAPSHDPSYIRAMVDDFLRRGLFTVEEARARTADPDMRERRGAQIVRSLLP